MSSNSGSSEESSEQGTNQASLETFVEQRCSVCGRSIEGETPSCHSERRISLLSRLATEDLLFIKRRREFSLQNNVHLSANDGVGFEPFYIALRDVFGHDQPYLAAYLLHFPCDIPCDPWIKIIYDKYHHPINGNIHFQDIIQLTERRISLVNAKVTPKRVFAHLVYLDQYGLLPGYDRFSDSFASLRDYCTDYYDIPDREINSKWVVERRVDRSKVYSTTPEFREVWKLDFEIQSPSNHPYPDCKPFCGTAIFEDHRDHNLITRYAVNELERLPSVDWATAPHTFYLQAGYDSNRNTTSSGPVLGFDFAGFNHKSDSEQMTYLGVVTDWEESLRQVYFQLDQIRKTTATGLLILPNRRLIHEFLLCLARREILDDPGKLPTSRADYLAIPNIQELHQQLLHQIPLFDGVAVYPRRKFMNEGFENIADLVQVPTDG